MRYFSLVLLFLSLSIWGADIQIPTLRSPVMDEAQFLSARQREDLNQLAYEIHTHQGPQITIFTVNDLQGYPIEEFSIRVAEKWKLGTKEKGNGLLIIVAKTERQMRIEVGEGIEGEVTDFEANQYIRNILTPAFKQGDFHGGLRLVMQDIAQKFNIQLSQEKKYVKRAVPPTVLPGKMIAAFPFFIAILIIGQLLLRKHPIARGLFTGAGLTGVSFFVGIASISLIGLIFLLGLLIGIIGPQNLLYAIASGHHRGGGFGGGFGGGSGGGWSGGGGGFSGGGSSGNW